MPKNLKEHIMKYAHYLNLVLIGFGLLFLILNLVSHAHTFIFSALAFLPSACYVCYFSLRALAIFEHFPLDP